MPVKIILVDDHRMIRQGLRVLLEREDDMTVVGEAENGREAVEILESISADVVVMDVNLPELNGLDATRRALAIRKNVKVVCISALATQRAASEALIAGAKAFVCKESAFDELVAAIRSVMAEEIYISPAVAGEVIQDFLKNPEEVTDGPLSLREREVLQLITEGRTTKEVAYRLHVSVKTIETHRRNVMEKLGIDSIAELTKFAVREGITSL